VSELLPSPSGRGSGSGETGRLHTVRLPFPSPLLLREGAKGVSLAVLTLTMAPMLPREEEQGEVERKRMLHGRFTASIAAP
jgi:hypothetical protein